MAKPTGIPKAAPSATPPAAEVETTQTTEMTETTKVTDDNPTPPDDNPTPPAAEVETGTKYLKAVKSTLFDSYGQRYFFTNRATKVETPYSNWVKCQVDAGVLEECAADFGANADKSDE
jgi:hypothetical protein